ncbi:hypothetical protein [Bradyrhizobium sp.]|uniref:hypothetical protein n=1 Tax=Bradyrhizobium sp. TaxID=376 RepID=UPI003D0990F1
MLSSNVSGCRGGGIFSVNCSIGCSSFRQRATFNQNQRSELYTHSMDVPLLEQ